MYSPGQDPRDRHGTIDGTVHMYGVLHTVQHYVGRRYSVVYSAGHRPNFVPQSSCISKSVHLQVHFRLHSLHIYILYSMYVTAQHPSPSSSKTNTHTHTHTHKEPGRLGGTTSTLRPTYTYAHTHISIQDSMYLHTVSQQGRIYIYIYVESAKHNKSRPSSSTYMRTQHLVKAELCTVVHIVPTALANPHFHPTTYPSLPPSKVRTVPYITPQRKK